MEIQGKEAEVQHKKSRYDVDYIRFTETSGNNSSFDTHDLLEVVNTELIMFWRPLVYYISHVGK